MTKTQLKRIVRQVAKEHGANLTRDQKWEIFTQVCDGMYAKKLITLQQHDTWTQPF